MDLKNSDYSPVICEDRREGGTFIMRNFAAIVGNEGRAKCFNICKNVATHFRKCFSVKHLRNIFRGGYNVK